MSQAIDRPGRFKAKLLDWGVTQTRKAELPQFVATFRAIEYFDEEENAWMDWAEYEQQIVGYFVLVTLDANGQIKKCMNLDQLVAALGWDGESYSGLAVGDWADVVVQIVVSEDTYNGNTSLKVSWIDAEDAQPGLRTLSADDIKKLDQQFAIPSDKPKKAAKAPAKKKADKEKREEPTPAASEPEKEAPPKRKKSAPPKSKKDKAPEPEDECTEEEAWNAVNDENEKLGDKGVPPEILEDYWLTRLAEIASDEDNPTPVEWAKIRRAVLEDVGIPF